MSHAQHIADVLSTLIGVTEIIIKDHAWLIDMAALVDLDTIMEQWQAESVGALAVSLDNVLTTLDRRRSAGTRS